MKNNQPAGWEKGKKKEPESWSAAVNTSQNKQVVRPVSWAATETGSKPYATVVKSTKVAHYAEEAPVPNAPVKEKKSVSVAPLKEKSLAPASQATDTVVTDKTTAVLEAKESEKAIAEKPKARFVWLLFGILLACAVAGIGFFAGRASTGEKMENQSAATENTLMETVATDAAEPTQEVELSYTTSETTEETVLKETDPTEASFEPYFVKVEYGELPIYDGPGFHYDIVGYITDFGTYTIVEEEEEYLNSGTVTTWGKLKSGAGWINLIDAADDIQNPIFCQECRRSIQETYISRYGYCEACYNEFGNCEKCGGIIDEVGASYYDGKRCYSCIACDTCGGPIEEWEYWKNNDYMCGDCYYEQYLLVGSCYLCGAACDVLAGICDSCYESLVYCQICGRACDPGDSDGICAICAAGECVYCGGPLSADHNCDDYPNVVCPNCGWGIYTTGVGTDGWDCPECGTNIIPESE